MSVPSNRFSPNPVAKNPVVAANGDPATTVGSEVTTAREELTQLAGEHGWEIGEYPAYVEVAKRGFIRRQLLERAPSRQRAGPSGMD